MSNLRFGIIISTTREGRFGDRPANWINNLANEREGIEAEILDLRDYPMPFFDEPTSPLFRLPKSEVAVKWGEKLNEFDAFIFVVAEYNHGIPAVLKNALDYAYPQFIRKPATAVGYGGTGAARAVEQLRTNLIEMQVAPIKPAVHINMIEFVGLLREGKDFSDYAHLMSTAKTMLDDLTWWALTLRAGREA